MFSHSHSHLPPNLEFLEIQDLAPLLPVLFFWDLSSRPTRPSQGPKISKKFMSQLTCPLLTAACWAEELKIIIVRNWTRSCRVSRQVGIPGETARTKGLDIYFWEKPVLVGDGKTEMLGAETYTWAFLAQKALHEDFLDPGLEFWVLGDRSVLWVVDVNDIWDESEIVNILLNTCTFTVYSAYPV